MERMRIFPLGTSFTQKPGNGDPTTDSNYFTRLDAKDKAFGLSRESKAVIITNLKVFRCEYKRPSLSQSLDSATQSRSGPLSRNHIFINQIPYTTWYLFSPALIPVHFVSSGRRVAAARPPPSRYSSASLQGHNLPIPIRKRLAELGPVR